MTWLLVVTGLALGYLRASHSHDECMGPTLKTNQGFICGSRVTVDENFTYRAYRGIPYARPPVGSLRFMVPQPPPAWTGVRKAVREAPNCLQSGQGEVLTTLSPTFRQAMLLFMALPGLLSTLASGRRSEDCLYLNVYTGLESNDTLKPVMVWVHGGGFHLGTGSADLYGPEYLLREDVILVTFNYRLGPLGFLSVPEGGVSGNAGMKDQVAALQWVQQNVASFGGDPSRVTLFGESAGATSVQLHMLSPISKGLFSRAISQSGSALNPRSTTTKGRERAYRLARLVGLSPRDDRELVRQLRGVPADRLIAMSESVLTPSERMRGLAVHPFVPAVEPPSDGAFLSAPVCDLLAKGDVAEVPYITGITSLEGGFMLNRNRRYRGEALNEEVERLVPMDLGLRPRSRESWEVARMMKGEYFADQDSPSDRELAEMYSDMFVVWAVQRTANFHYRRVNAPLYLYIMSYDGNLAPSHRIVDKRLPGVNHADEVGYLFPLIILPRKEESSTDILVKNRLVKLWTNFAKTGNPNIERSPLLTSIWPTANNASLLYLDIGEDLRVRRGDLSTHMKLWNILYPESCGGRTKRS